MHHLTQRKYVQSLANLPSDPLLPLPWSAFYYREGFLQTAVLAGMQSVSRLKILKEDWRQGWKESLGNFSLLSVLSGLSYSSCTLFRSKSLQADHGTSFGQVTWTNKNILSAEEKNKLCHLPKIIIYMKYYDPKLNIISASYSYKYKKINIIRHKKSILL